MHVDLWWRGINLARDAGTYLYNGGPPWNNGLAGTAVHNTVTVDHRDQMRRAGRFLWVDWAQALGRLHSSSAHACADRFEGEHDGYRSLGVKHRRMVQWLGGQGWVIVDDIEGAGEHDVRVHWLTADLPYEVADSPFQVAFTAGQSRVRWNIFSSSTGNGAIVRAGVPVDGDSAGKHEQLLGWESPTYGDLRPAISLVYQTRSQLPVRFVTVVLTDERCHLETGEQIVIRRDESEIYRVDLSEQALHAKDVRPPAASVLRP